MMMMIFPKHGISTNIFCILLLLPQHNPVAWTRQQKQNIPKVSHHSNSRTSDNHTITHKPFWGWSPYHWAKLWRESAGVDAPLANLRYLRQPSLTQTSWREDKQPIFQPPITANNCSRTGFPPKDRSDQLLYRSRDLRRSSRYGIGRWSLHLQQTRHG